MRKLAFIFPGQGSQRVGMGTELKAARGEVFSRYISQAEEASGLPIGNLCAEGPQEELTRTEVAQPALFALSLAIHELARELGLRADLMAGHSLGEYTAVVAAGALSVPEGMRLVAERGRLMAEIQVQRPGAMAAIIGLSADEVGAVCEAASAVGIVAPANLNTASQIVVSGEQAAVTEAIERALAAGAAKAVRLQTGGAFHSELMGPVQEQLAQTMDKLTWIDPEVPVVSNAFGEPVQTAARVRAALLAQIASPVRWVECVTQIVAAGCSFAELGPGRVLTGLVRSIAREAQTFAADSPAKLAAIADQLSV